ncbi:T9SS type A sorting domain-containing protein [Calditrichota bacterium]
MKLSVYDMLCKKVAELVNENQSAGFHQVSWDAGTLSSGIYLYRLQAVNYSQVRKILLVR